MSADLAEYRALKQGAPKAVDIPVSEDTLALRFAETHARDLRYIQAWGKWMIWEASYWRPDDSLLAFDKAREICRIAASELDKPKDAKSLTQAATVAAVERLSKADRRIAAVPAQWDADAWILNTPGGIVDLRTGCLGASDPDQYCTKITAVTPAAIGTQPVRWLSFLGQITDNDAELIRFLQRAIGYSLTGVVTEHALFFGYGTGANGKGTFLNTFSRLLGNYATVSSMDTFTASSSDRHPTDLAMLRGARFVTAQETEEGRRWAESKIKALTGGDPVTARFMRQDFFTYEPTFKIFIAGNHKPGLRQVDEAIRRRLHLIPFSVTIPTGQRDPDLAEHLKAEWPAILRWGIEGCLAWQADGLNPPSIVKDTTAEYLEAEDIFGLWVEDSIEDYRGDFEKSADLFAHWKRYAEAAGEIVGNQRGFTQNLETRGYKRKATKTAKGFADIRLKRPDYSDDLRYGA